MKQFLCVWATAIALVVVGAEADIDGRPYEFVWANRKADDRPVLLPLVDPVGWTVTCSNAVATFQKTADHKLFGDGVARLVYRATGPKPVITLRPPQPVPVAPGADTISFWVYGNNVSYLRDASTPSVGLAAEFADAAGRTFTVPVYHVRHLEWFLVQRRFAPDVIRRLVDGGRFLGFIVTGGTNEKDRQIELTSLAVYREELKPLAFKPRPKRPYRVFPDAPAGVNTGAGMLPFPTRASGVIPPVSEKAAAEIEFRAPTSAVDWDDLAVRVKGGTWRRFAQGAGVYTATSNGPRRVARDDVKTVFRVEGQSIVAEVQGPADIAEIDLGALAEFPDVRIFTVPYYSYSMTGGENRPHVAILDLDGRPFFHAATMDWTQSNGSEPVCDVMTFAGVAKVHGRVVYHPKTDGTRNPCYERIVWSFSPEFADVLPAIPNPPSPYRELTAEYQWCHMAAQKDRARDKAYWRNRKRRGLDKVFIGDHEVCMRDGNESFTFRTQPAPGKGGDEGMRDFTRYMIDELGYLYGPYNNYTDFAPINAHWHADRVTRAADNQLRPAWNRCYAPKPTYAVEACEAIVPVLQGKFAFNSGYCDVHTCVSPWERCDYDARVPGGGTFAGTFYAYGELLGLQRTFWNGPVYSEGGVHFLYCGLDDGNFAQDQGYRLDLNPWIVDFDLLRLHPLANNFGMGYPTMFFPKAALPKDHRFMLDRFLTATIAFGHIGYFLTGRPDDEENGYWMLQAPAARYAKADVAAIAYADAGGRFLPTSQALATGATERSQVRVRYTDGTVVTANGSAAGDGLAWDAPGDSAGGRFLLPANGWFAETGDGQVASISGSRPFNTTTSTIPVRADACVSPHYVYLDGRGTWFETPFGAAAGRLIRIRATNGTDEVFLRHASEAALPYAAVSVEMLDEAGASLGPARTRTVDGRTWLTADAKAFSYRVVRPADWREPSAATLAGAFRFVAGMRPPAVKRAAAPIFTLPKTFMRGMALRGRPEEVLRGETGAGIRPTTSIVGGVAKQGWYMHPPYKGGVGYVFMRWNVRLPETPLKVSVQIGKLDSSPSGDGALYQIAVEDETGRHIVAAKQTAEHRWQTLAADLSPWAGKRVRLFFISDVGPANDSSGDHASWCDIAFTSCTAECRR